MVTSGCRWICMDAPKCEWVRTGCELDANRCEWMRTGCDWMRPDANGRDSMPKVAPGYASVVAEAKIMWRSRDAKSLLAWAQQ